MKAYEPFVRSRCWAEQAIDLAEHTDLKTTIITLISGEYNDQPICDVQMVSDDGLPSLPRFNATSIQKRIKCILAAPSSCQLPKLHINCFSNDAVCMCITYERVTFCWVLVALNLRKIGRAHV